MRIRGLIAVFILLLGVLFLVGQKGRSQKELLAAFLKKNNASAPVKEAYGFALEHGDVLEEIPCYCGCSQMGHDDNKDCFIGKNGGFAKMGLNCGECVAIALDSKRLFGEGESTEEIREFIVQKYSHD